MLKRNFTLILSCTIIISFFSVSAYGDSVDDMHDSAYALMKNGEYEKGIEVYTAILDIEEYADSRSLPQLYLRLYAAPSPDRTLGASPVLPSPHVTPRSANTTS